MTKRRMVHECIWQSESVTGLTIRQRLLWIGLITTADDQGRGRAHPGLVRATIFPFDTISLDEIQDDLNAIAATGMAILYTTKDKQFYQVVHWWEFQTPQWASPSDYPSPDNWQDHCRYHSKREIVLINWNLSESKQIPRSLPRSLPRQDTDSKVDSKVDGNLSLEDKSNDNDKSKIHMSASADFHTLLTAWRELFPKKPQPRPETKSLQSKAAVRFKDIFFRENWRKALEKVSHSEFCLTGGWFDLGWFLKNDENWQKCLNGNYDKPNGNGRTKPDPYTPPVRNLTEERLHGNSG